MKYTLVKCDKCGKSVRDNWLIAHKKSNCKVGAPHNFDTAVTLAKEIVEMRNYINTLEDTIDQWVEVGDKVQRAATGKAGPLSDSDVIGEIERMRSLLQTIADYDPWNDNRRNWIESCEYIQELARRGLNGR